MTNNTNDWYDYDQVWGPALLEMKVKKEKKRQEEVLQKTNSSNYHRLAEEEATNRASSTVSSKIGIVARIRNYFKF